MVRTERESDRSRIVGAAETSKERAEWRRFQWKSAEKERVASVSQREQLLSTPEPPLPRGKGTEPSVQSTRSWGGGGESSGGREPHLGE